MFTSSSTCKSTQKLNKCFEKKEHKFKLVCCMIQFRYLLIVHIPLYVNNVSSSNLWSLQVFERGKCDYNKLEKLLRGVLLRRQSCWQVGRCPSPSLPQKNSEQNTIFIELRNKSDIIERGYFSNECKRQHRSSRKGCSPKRSSSGGCWR